MLLRPVSDIRLSSAIYLIPNVIYCQWGTIATVNTSDIDKKSVSVIVTLTVTDFVSSSDNAEWQSVIIVGVSWWWWQRWQWYPSYSVTINRLASVIIDPSFRFSRASNNHSSGGGASMASQGPGNVGHAGHLGIVTNIIMTACRNNCLEWR